MLSPTFIETIEREDICDRFYEIAFVAGVRDNGDPTQKWREW